VTDGLYFLYAVHISRRESIAKDIYQLYRLVTFCINTHMQILAGKRAVEEREGDLNVDKVKLHLSGLIGMANNPDMQKSRIIGFISLKIGYIGSLKFCCYYLQ